MNKVSVLIVSYNAEKYIEKTVKSCLYQTYNNIEVLLLDNNSQDKTVEIVKKIALQDNRLNIFESKKNLGPYKGLNFLLEKAGGEYIAIQDHDDVWFPEKIEKQVKFLEKNKDFIACGTNTFYYYEARGILILNKKSLITNFVDHTSLMFRNKKFKYNTKYLLADEHFEKNILTKSGKIACLKNPMAVHRIKGDKSNLSKYRFKFYVRNIKEFFKINGLNKKSIIYFFCMIANNYLPENFTWSLWRLSKKFLRRKNIWITIENFNKNYSNIDL